VTGTFSGDDAGYRVRLWIWDGAARMIEDHAAFGVGLGNFQYHSPAYLGEALWARGPGGHYFNRLHTLHAHSDYLEVLAETGIVGACLLLAFFALLPRVRSPAWAGLAAALVFSLLNTTLHSPPHVLGVLLCAAALPRRRSAAKEDANRARWRSRALWITGTLIVCAVVIGANLAPNYLMARAESTVAAGNPGATLNAYRDASRLPGSAYAACEALAILDANAGRFREAERLVDCARLGLDTGDVHYLAGYVAEMQGNNAHASAEYAACVLRWPDHVRAWEGRLALAPESERDALLAQALPWLGPPAAERLTTLRAHLRSQPSPRSDATAP
jgi:hypothetical protein